MIIKQMFGIQTEPTDSWRMLPCEFEATEGQAAGDNLRVITTEGKKAQGVYAMSITEKILSYNNSYFGASRGVR